MNAVPLRWHRMTSLYDTHEKESPVSQLIPDLSRRKLLRLASYTTLATLAAGCSTRADAEMRDVLGGVGGAGGVDEECDREKECSFKMPDPKDPEKDLEISSAKLLAVAEVLWTKFKGGVNSNGKNDVDLAPGVFHRAFVMSGPFVLCNLPGYPDDPDSIDTMNCTALCGQKAAAAARTKWEEEDLPGRPTIDATLFEAAWCATQKETRDKFSRLRNMSGGLTGGDDPGDITGGMGCT